MKSATAMQILNPATGEVIGPIREHTIEELHDAVAAARTAQKSWAARPLAERTRLAYAARRYLVEHADEIAVCISRSTGKTRIDALSTEVLPSALAAGYYARIARGRLARRPLRRSSLLFFNKRSYLTRVPYGVIGIISPWNYPFSIPFHEVIMALLAGNAIILKVATQTQEVGEEIAALLSGCGLPNGLFKLIHLPGAVAGPAMIEAGIDKLFFTGSTAVGKELMAKAAERLTPLVLELGGSDAMLVLEDANLDRAAAGAVWAGLSNAGQSCAGVQRILVHERVYEPFRERLLRQVAALRVGPDRSFDVDIGSLTSPKQREEVARQVEATLKRGGKAEKGAGEATGASGSFYPPTVVEAASDEAPVMSEEVFGPVLALRRFRDEEEAIRLANASEYGLTASVWSGSWKRGRRVAERLEAGSVTLNDHLMSHGMAETPWGGFRHSGIGRSHGELGFDEMTQPRVLVRDGLHRLPRNMWWYPHDKALYDGLKGALIALYGRGLFRRLAAMGRLVGTFSRSFRRGS